jgi:hypothetical protein
MSRRNVWDTDVGGDAIDLAHRRQVGVETAAHHGHGDPGVDIGVGGCA